MSAGAGVSKHQSLLEVFLDPPRKLVCLGVCTLPCSRRGWDFLSFFFPSQRERKQFPIFFLSATQAGSVFFFFFSESAGGTQEHVPIPLPAPSRWLWLNPRLVLRPIRRFVLRKPCCLFTPFPRTLAHFHPHPSATPKRLPQWYTFPLNRLRMCRWSFACAPRRHLSAGSPL